MQLTRVFLVLERRPGPVADLAQTIALTEGLVGHILELVRHLAGTPSRGVVLNDGCRKVWRFAPGLMVGHSHLLGAIFLAD